MNSCSSLPRSLLRSLESSGLRRIGLRSCLACGVLAAFAARAPAQTVDTDFVFVSRALQAPTAPDGTPPLLRRRAVDHARWGKLIVHEAGGGRLRTLVDGESEKSPGTPLDVMDPSVSFDATRIVFSGYSRQEYAFRIYEIRVDGSGLRQVTRSTRQIDLARFGEAAPQLADYDDVDPCYLPDGRICFVSTRYPGVAPDDRAQATNLYVVKADGSDLHRITSERFGADTPAVEPATGRIVYSRWWRTAQPVDVQSGEEPAPIPPGSPEYGGGQASLPVEGGRPRDVAPDVDSAAVTGVSDAEFPGVNSWFLAGINPDGSGLAMYSGFRLNREQTQAYRPSFFPDGGVLALFIPRTPLLGLAGSNGLRRFEIGAKLPQPLGGPQGFVNFSSIDSTQFVYHSAEPLPDGRILATARDTSAGNPHEYDIYLKPKAEAGPQMLLRMAGTAELDAVPIVSRHVPRVVVDSTDVRLSDEVPVTLEEAYERGGKFIFQVENIHFNAPVDFPIPTAPPIGKRLAIEFYTNFQRTGLATADPPILIRTAEIGADGKVSVELPAGVPLFEVLRRPDGTIARGRDGQIFHVGGMNFGQAGTRAQCVGCHAGHSMLPVPAVTAWTNLATSATVAAPDLAERGRDFPAQLLVDRRTDRQMASWKGPSFVDGEPDRPRIELHWSVPVRAREIILHGGGSSAPKRGEQLIWALTVTTSLQGVLREEHYPTRSTLVEKISIRPNPALEFDALSVSIKGYWINGAEIAGYNGNELPPLAEIEVIGQAVDTPSGPRAWFLRGDANCEGGVDISDPNRILESLYLGGGSLCCEAAADADADGVVGLTDAIYLLSYSFLGGKRPGAPFPSCGAALAGDLTCDTECR